MVAHIRRIKYGGVIIVSIFVFAFIKHSILSQYFVFLCESLVEVNSAVESNLKQDNKALIQYIRNYVLWPPDDLPYNLSDATNPKYSRDNIEPILDIIFNNKTHGIFFEAGAFDGETASNTLYIEKERSWTGLLVEGNAQKLVVLKEKHRKSWVAPVLLCTNSYPQKVTFYEADLQSWIKDYQPDYRGRTFRCPPKGKVLYFPNMTQDDYEYMKEMNCSLMKTKETTHQCFPLYSLLEAAGITTIDFMSLDVEGTELAIIDSLPLEKLNIKVLLMEVLYTGYLNKTGIADKMKSKGYMRLDTLGNVDLRYRFVMDMMFVKEGLSLPIE